MNRFRTWQQAHPVAVRIGLFLLFLYFPLLGARAWYEVYSDSWTLLHKVLFAGLAYALFPAFIFLQRQLRMMTGFRIVLAGALERILYSSFFVGMILMGVAVGDYREHSMGKFIFDLVWFVVVSVLFFAWKQHDAKKRQARVADTVQT